MTAEVRPAGRGQGEASWHAAVPGPKAPVLLTLLVPSSSHRSRAGGVPAGRGSLFCSNSRSAPVPRGGGQRQAGPTRVCPLCPSGALDTVPRPPPKVKVGVFWLTQNRRDEFLGKNVLFIRMLFIRVLETHLYCQAFHRIKRSERKTASELGRNQEKASGEKHVHPLVCFLIPS